MRSRPCFRTTSLHPLLLLLLPLLLLLLLLLLLPMLLLLLLLLKLLQLLLLLLMLLLLLLLIHNLKPLTGKGRKSTHSFGNCEGPPIGADSFRGSLLQRASQPVLCIGLLCLNSAHRPRLLLQLSLLLLLLLPPPLLLLSLLLSQMLLLCTS